MINAIYHCRMFATCFVQPLDLVKNRMQVCVVSDRSRPSSASVLMGVIRNEGFRTLYTGLSAGMLRQATYTTTRLGNWLYNKWMNLHFTKIRPIKSSQDTDTHPYQMVHFQVLIKFFLKSFPTKTVVLQAF